MSNLFCVEIESNSTMFDSLSIQDSHQKKSQKKILNKKREREKTEVEVEKKRSLQKNLKQSCISLLRFQKKTNSSEKK